MRRVGTVVITVGLLLSGCSGGQDPQPPPEGTAAPSPPGSAAAAPDGGRLEIVESRCGKVTDSDLQSCAVILRNTSRGYVSATARLGFLISDEVPGSPTPGRPVEVEGRFGVVPPQTNSQIVVETLEFRRDRARIDLGYAIAHWVPRDQPIPVQVPAGKAPEAMPVAAIVTKVISTVPDVNGAVVKVSINSPYRVDIAARVSVLTRDRSGRLLSIRFQNGRTTVPSGGSEREFPVGGLADPGRTEIEFHAICAIDNADCPD